MGSSKTTFHVNCHQKSKTQGYRTVGFARMFTIFWNILQFCLENEVQQRKTNSKSWTTKILDPPKQKSSHRNYGLGLWSAVFYSWKQTRSLQNCRRVHFLTRMSQNEFKRMAQNSGAVFRGVTLFLYSLHSYYVIIHDTTGDWLWCCVFCILDVLLKGQGGDCCKDFAAWMNID